MALDVIVESTPAPIEMSMSDIRAALANDPAPAAEPETATPEPTAEPEASAEAKTTETESGTVEEQPKPEDTEPELPEGVKKRIAAEAKKQAFFQSKIDRAVSERKAAEARARELEAGSQPEPTSAQPSTAEPVAPKPTDFPTWGEYLEADAKYRADFKAYLLSETTRTVREQFAVEQQQAADRQAWNAALKDHPELPGMTQTVLASAPEGLQVAISALDNWAGVTVHLGKHPEELAALVQEFTANPYRGVVSLGKLEDRLNPATKPAVSEPPKPAAKPLPPPVKNIGGGASATVQGLNLGDAAAVEKATDAAFMSAIRQYVKPKAK